MRSLVALLLAAAASGATAQIRNIPDDARIGTVRNLEPMQIEQDGERRALAPGLQVRDVDNRIVLPEFLQDGEEVRYLIDPAGMVYRVWKLSAPEKEALPRPPSPFPR